MSGAVLMTSEEYRLRSDIVRRGRKFLGPGDGTTTVFLRPRDGKDAQWPVTFNVEKGVERISELPHVHDYWFVS